MGVNKLQRRHLPAWRVMWRGCVCFLACRLNAESKSTAFFVSLEIKINYQILIVIKSN